MPPRIQTRARGPRGHEVSNAESGRAPSLVVRRRGCVRGRNRGKGKGRGREARMADEPTPEANVAGTTAEFRAVHQTLKTLVGLMANQVGAGAQPHTEPAPQGQRQTPFPRGAKVTIESFLKLQPPVFMGNLLAEDPQDFID